MAFAHRSKFIRSPNQDFREVIQTLVESGNALSIKPEFFHLQVGIVIIVGVANKAHPKRIKNILALAIWIGVGSVQIHRRRKRIAIDRVDVAHQAMDFGNVACLKTGKPRGFQIHHALCARAHAWTCKTVDIVLTIRMASHLSKQSRNRRGFHLVFRRKTAAIENLKIGRFQSHFLKELAFCLTATFNTALAYNLRTEIAQQRFGMEILAALIDFIENAQERSCRERESFKLGIIFRISFFEDYTTILERIHECSPKIPNRVSDREHHTCRIDILANRPTERNDGLVGVNRIHPFFLEAFDRF